MERSEGRFAMKAVADTLAVARSNLIEHVSAAPSGVGPIARPVTMSFCADPPAGGRAPNLRVSAYPAPHKPAAKGQRKAASQWQACAADHAGQPTDARTDTGRWPGRTHDGVVIALRSNIRWCPDHFEPPVVMARSCVCCLLLMPAIARLWAGWPPPPASPARWCAT